MADMSALKRIHTLVSNHCQHGGYSSVSEARLDGEIVCGACLAIAEAIVAPTFAGRAPDFTMIELPTADRPHTWAIVRQNEHVVSGIEIMPHRFATAAEAREFVRELENDLALANANREALREDNGPTKAQEAEKPKD